MRTGQISPRDAVIVASINLALHFQMIGILEALDDFQEMMKKRAVGTSHLN